MKAQGSPMPTHCRRLLDVAVVCAGLILALGGLRPLAARAGEGPAAPAPAPAAPAPGAPGAVVPGGATQVFPLADVRPGMRGHGLTVKSGTKVERFDVEVVDVMHHFLMK